MGSKSTPSFPADVELTRADRARSCPSDIDLFYALVGGSASGAPKARPAWTAAEPARKAVAPAATADFGNGGSGRTVQGQQRPTAAPGHPATAGRMVAAQPPVAAQPTGVVPTSANPVGSGAGNLRSLVVAAEAVRSSPARASNVTPAPQVSVIASTAARAAEPVRPAGPAAWAAVLGEMSPAVTAANASVKRSRRGQPSWSPKLLCLHLTQFCTQGLPERVNKMEVESWVRRVSEDAMLRLTEAQTRLNGARPKPRG